jgi:hypothetical protein
MIPTELSMPLAIRLSTINTTPPIPRASPVALRQVICSSRTTAASSAVSTGFALTIIADKPDEMLRIPT